MLITDILKPVTYPLDTALPMKGRYIDNGELSNYYPGCPVRMFGRTYDTVEAAYVAAKNPQFVVVEDFGETTRTTSFPQYVSNHELQYGLKGLKNLGKKSFLTELRPNWERLNLALMYEFIRQKVGNPKTCTGKRKIHHAISSHLTVWLLTTPYDQFIEYNNWGDFRWGAIVNKEGTAATGYNCLGGLYSVLRREILTGVQVIPEINSTTSDDALMSMQDHLLRNISYLRKHIQNEPEYGIIGV